MRDTGQILGVGQGQVRKIQKAFFDAIKDSELDERIKIEKRKTATSAGYESLRTDQ